MDCDICYESFDHLKRKPLLLIRCAHTLCASCVSSLTDRKCPSCSGIIEDTQTNWSMLKVVVDSKFEEANAKCDQSKAITVYPDEIKGTKFFESNDFKNAFAHFKKLTEKHPDYELGHWLKSRAECQLNLNQGMSKFFDAIEGIEPKGSAYDYLNKGVNLYCKQQYNAAIILLNKAIDLNPEIIKDDAIPLGQIALSYMRLGQLEESLKWFDKAIKARPQCAVSFCNKGVLLNSMSKYDEALVNLDKAIQLNPKYNAALFNRAISLVKLGRREDAKESLNRANQSSNLPADNRANDIFN